jgi:hypothetical protein
MAVGNYATTANGQFIPLAETWNGTTWGLVAPSSPTIGSLADVSCVSSRWCMAVGTAGSQPVAELWNGSSWQPQTLVSPGGYQSVSLASVSCPAASSCMAVGQAGQGGGDFVPLAEHWDGSAWSLQSTATPAGSVAVDLSGVSCASPTSCTAVGGYNNTQGLFTGTAYAVSWDGSTWTLQTTPNPSGAQFSGLAGVSCPLAASCLGVGYFDGGIGTSPMPLSEADNSTNWAPAAPPLPSGAQGGEIGEVSCAAPSNCEGAGQAYASPETPLAEHWDGSAWEIQVLPAPSGVFSSVLSGISCPTASFCAATGNAFATSSGPQSAFIEWYGP